MLPKSHRAGEGPASSQGRDVQAEEQEPSDLQVPTCPGPLYSLTAAGILCSWRHGHTRSCWLLPQHPRGGSSPSLTGTGTAAGGAGSQEPNHTRGEQENPSPNHPPCPGINLFLHPKEPDTSKPPHFPGKQGACPSSPCWSTGRGTACSLRNFQSSDVLSRRLGVKEIPQRHKAHKNQQPGAGLDTQLAQHPPRSSQHQALGQGSNTRTELFQPQPLGMQGHLIPSYLQSWCLTSPDRQPSAS